LEFSAERTFRYWLPVILAAAVISIFSTQGFGETHTTKIIIPILRWMFPSASLHTLHLMHVGIRKLAHLAEYSVLSILVFRALRAGRAGWRMSWALATVLIAASYASLDEIHQIFVPGRGPAAHDVAIDTFGALLAQVMVWLYATIKWSYVARSQAGIDGPRPLP
jgi:VanZ family protein